MIKDLEFTQAFDGSLKAVAIMLATFNGAKFLAEQLYSIECQTHTNWCVYASDDGSTDETLAILANYRERWGQARLKITEGPHNGHAANFLFLIRDQRIKADYYAFCDQDDIWLADKLERSISTIIGVGEMKPAIYGSRTTLIDDKGSIIGLSPHFKRKPDLKNALVQSLFGGNTILFNNETRNCLRLIPSHQEVVAHDWVAYLMVCACGGEDYYDEVPSLLYRQHDNNSIGSNNRMKDRLVRIRWLFQGRFKYYSDKNLDCLTYLNEKITSNNAAIIGMFSQMRTMKFWLRLNLFQQLGLYRQTLFGTLGLWVAIVTNKI
jgi:glycosyltransferase involved in cell wall biosynthesis